MKRLLRMSAVALPVLVATTLTLQADVRTRDKSQIKFEGMLGRMAGMFGGKAAKEGIVSTTAVKGNRKAVMNDESGQIVDLSEEKVYDLDLKKKTYQVTTFDEIRRRMREAREKAEQEARKEGGQQQQAGEPGKEMEIDFDVKETGQKKAIAGYDARNVIMTITLREKGRTLDEGGGLVVTADSWLGPQIPAMREVADFEMRYWKQLQGADAAGMSPEQMAAVMAMYPLVQKAMDRLKQEATKLEGTPLSQTTKFEAVKSKAQMSEQQSQGGGGGLSGGLGGMLARKMKKENPGQQRATIFTMQNEVQEVATSVPAEDLAIPAGFKEKK